MRGALLIVFSVLVAAAVVGLWPAPDASLPVPPRGQSVPPSALVTVASPAQVPVVIARQRPPVVAPPRLLAGVQAKAARPLADAGISVPPLLSARPLAIALLAAAPHSESRWHLDRALVEPASAPGAVTRGIVTAGEQISGALTRAGRAIRVAF